MVPAGDRRPAAGAAPLRRPRVPPPAAGYRYERTPAAEGVTYTIRRCPVAAYFQAHGAADLCVGSWCNLDYGLAEIWGGRLERASTLAAGGDRCDFRLTVAQASPTEGAGG